MIVFLLSPEKAVLKYMLSSSWILKCASLWKNVQAFPSAVLRGRRGAGSPRSSNPLAFLPAEAAVNRGRRGTRVTPCQVPSEESWSRSRLVSGSSFFRLTHWRKRPPLETCLTALDCKEQGPLRYPKIHDHRCSSSFCCPLGRGREQAQEWDPG